MTSMLDFLNGSEFFDENDPKILDDFVDQLNAESKSTNFTVPGTVSIHLSPKNCQIGHVVRITISGVFFQPRDGNSFTVFFVTKPLA